MRIIKHITYCFLLTVYLCHLVMPVPVGAHCLLMEPVEEGAIKVYYNDGRFSMRTEVIAYDDQNREIMRGSLDENGYFHYPTDEEIVLLVADDGLGHRAELFLHSETAEAVMPMGFTVTLVVAGFIALAGIFHYRNRGNTGRKMV